MKTMVFKSIGHPYKLIVHNPKPFGDDNIMKNLISKLQDGVNLEQQQNKQNEDTKERIKPNQVPRSISLNEGEDQFDGLYAQNPNASKSCCLNDPTCQIF